MCLLIPDKYSINLHDEENRIGDIFKELQSFKDFQSSVGNKPMKMEESIISNCSCYWQTQKIGDESDATARFVTDFLENRITALENELSRKDAIIDYLSKQLVISANKNSHINNNIIASNNKNMFMKVWMSWDFTGSFKVNRKEWIERLNKKRFCGRAHYIE